MKLTGKEIVRRFHHEWSVLTMIILLLLLSLTMMCCLEFLGLLNNSKNIDYRLPGPEAIIRSKIEKNRAEYDTTKNIFTSEFGGKDTCEKVTILSENIPLKGEASKKFNKISELRQDLMDNMIIEAASSQKTYEANRKDPKVDIIRGELFFFYV